MHTDENGHLWFGSIPIFHCFQVDLWNLFALSGPLGLFLGSNALLGPTYVSNQRYSHIFLNYDLAPFWVYCLFWPFWAIFSSLGIIFWLEVRFKIFFLSTKGIYYFWLGENSFFFFDLIWPHLGPFLHLLGPLGLF